MCVCVCVCILDAAAMKRICGYNSARGGGARRITCGLTESRSRTNPCRISDINLPSLSLVLYTNFCLCTANGVCRLFFFPKPNEKRYSAPRGDRFHLTSGVVGVGVPWRLAGHIYCDIIAKD